MGECGLFSLCCAGGSVVAGDDIQLTAWWRGQSGGPFEARIYQDGTMGIGTGTTLVDGLDFLTFCVEPTENYYDGERFNIEGLSSGSLKSGKSLSNYSAWVYDKFVQLCAAWNISPATTASDAATLAHIPGSFGLSVGAALNAYQNAILAGMVGSDGAIGGKYSANPYFNAATDPALLALHLRFGHLQLNELAESQLRSHQSVRDVGEPRVVRVWPR